MKRKTIALILWGIIMFASISSCSRGEGASSENDSISFNTKKVADTSSFKRSNGEVCKVSVKTELSIPSAYKGKAIDKKFLKLFTSTVLEGNDSTDLETAIRQLVLDRLADNTQKGTEEQEEDDALPTSNIEIGVKVYPVYNSKGILSMCFEETVKKDGVVSVVHSYFNYDMENCAVVDMSDFISGATSELSQLLQKKLMEQNKVETVDDLNSIGYFDIYNITPTSNFYISNKGVVWSYKPQELTVDANTEPTILIPYSDLAPFVKEKSVINSLM